MYGYLDSRERCCKLVLCTGRIEAHDELNKPSFLIFCNLLHQSAKAADRFFDAITYKVKTELQRK